MVDEDKRKRINAAGIGALIGLSVAALSIGNAGCSTPETKRQDNLMPLAAQDIERQMLNPPSYNGAETIQADAERKMIKIGSLNYLRKTASCAGNALFATANCPFGREPHYPPCANPIHRIDPSESETERALEDAVGCELDMWYFGNSNDREGRTLTFICLNGNTCGYERVEVGGN